MSQMASRAVTAAEAAGCLAQGHYNKEGGLLNTPPLPPSPRQPVKTWTQTASLTTVCVACAAFDHLRWLITPVRNCNGLVCNEAPLQIIQFGGGGGESMLVSAPMVCVIHTSAQQTDFTSRTRSVCVCGCVCVYTHVGSLDVTIIEMLFIGILNLVSKYYGQ